MEQNCATFLSILDVKNTYTMHQIGECGDIGFGKHFCGYKVSALCHLRYLAWCRGGNGEVFLQ